jgi:membrane protease YdiL (CAAX protease family)
MMAFHILALALTMLWLIVVGLPFRSLRVLRAGGLIALGVYALIAFALRIVPATDLGLEQPASWLWTVMYAAGWTALMLAYSPVADWIATRFVAKPPTLDAFKPLQESWLKLVIGIAIAWLLGGFVEELVFRGMVLRAIEDLAGGTPTVASAAGIVVAAIGAGIAHKYQGLRAMIIITQLSVLFGVLFVATGHNLYAVILCHGFYDTVAFIRFAMGRSRYSKPS